MTDLDQEIDQILSQADWGYKYQMSDYASSKAAEEKYEREGLAEIAVTVADLKALALRHTEEVLERLLEQEEADPESGDGRGVIRVSAVRAALQGKAQ